MQAKQRTALVVAVYVFVTFVSGCSNSGGASDPQIPSWLQAKIDSLDVSPEMRTQVTRYRYNNADVYYVGPAMPDDFGSLYDSDGNVIAFPDGGFDGRGDGRCADFFEARSEEKVLWSVGER